MSAYTVHAAICCDGETARDAVTGALASLGVRPVASGVRDAGTIVFVLRLEADDRQSAERDGRSMVERALETANRPERLLMVAATG